MTNPTTNYSFVLPASASLVTNLPADFDVALQGVDTRLKALQPGTTLGDLVYSSATANTSTRLGIGTNGQVLSISGGVPAWATTADQTPLTTKGDLFTFTTVDARLGIGANNTVLTADSAQATGMKWAVPTGGGKVLQVLQDTVTAIVINSTTTYADTGLDVIITPSANTSKVLILANLNGLGKGTGNANNGVNLQIIRGATSVYVGGQGQSYNGAAVNNITTSTLVYLDSPATTSATTYKVQFSSTVAAQAATLNDYRTSDTVVSSLIVMEIGA